MSKWVFVGFAWMISVYTILSLLAIGGVTANPESITMPQDFAKSGINNTDEPQENQNWFQRTKTCITTSGIFQQIVFPLWCPIQETFSPIFTGQVRIPVLSEIMDVIRISVGTINFLWQITVFSVDELPGIANLILFGPMAASFIYMIIGILRGFGAGE